LLSLSVLAMVEVRAAGRCPPAGAVEQRLAPILPTPAPASFRNDVALVDESGDGSLTLSLSRPDGTLVGRRQLPRAATCADQADTVAVTLAVWEAEIHPEIALRLDRLPGPGGAPSVTADAADATPDRAVASAAPPPPPPAAVATVAPAPPSPEEPPTRFGLGVALGAVAAPSTPGDRALTARIDLSLGDESPWQARLSAVGIGERTMTVAPGQVGWRRFYLALAAEREVARSRGGGWAVVLGAGPTAGFVALAGAGFPLNRSVNSFDAGLEAVARFERWFGHFGLWLAATSGVWFRSQEVAILGGTEVTGATLPRVEAMAVLGGSFYSRR
jgi:hypothetical protein